MARLQALLRRHGGNPQPILTWGALGRCPQQSAGYLWRPATLADAQRVRHAGAVIAQSRKRYSVLGPCLTMSGSRPNPPGEEVVRYHIKELRRKLSDASAPKDLIETLHRVGLSTQPHVFVMGGDPG